MKTAYVVGLFAGTMLLQACNETKVEVPPAEITLDSEIKKVSYGIGLGLGERFKNDNIDVDIDVFSQAIKDGLSGADPKMSQEEVVTVMQAYQQKKLQERQQEQQAAAEKNKAESEAFLAENAKKDGVVVLESGLQYKVVTAGKGAKPSATDEVEVHYKGTLIDGTEFDSSYKRGSTVSFPVNGVIAGWTEALQLMEEGSKWELYIPSDLAYGPGGTGGAIGPDAALVFDVELVSVKQNTEEKEK